MENLMKLSILYVFFASILIILINFIYTNRFWSPPHYTFTVSDQTVNRLFLKPTEFKYERYVLYECRGQDLCGGLADRLKAVMNAYAWALFTGRTLIVNISKPCYFERLLAPNSINWNLNLAELVETGRLPKNYSRIEVNQIDNMAFKGDIKNMDIPNYFKDTHVIKLMTNLEWISAYNKNMYLNKTIKEIGFTPGEFHFSNAYNKWFPKLFKLAPDIEQKFEFYRKKAKPDSTKPLICIQVRIGGSRPNVGYDEEQTPRNFSTFYWEFVGKKLIANLTSKYRIFVTADTEAVEKEAIEQFGTEKVIVIPGISAHVDRESDQKENCSRYEKIVMDFWMLGYCDKALISDSGFGVFGILQTKIPTKDFYLLTIRKNRTSPKPDIFDLNEYIHSNPHRY